MYKHANLTIMVSDMKRSLAFYGDTLGLPRGRAYGDEWAEINAPGMTLGLHPGGKRPLADHARHFSIGLQVDDLDAAVAQLSARGITFSPGPPDRGLRIAYFTDPDGNPLYLCEVKWG